MLDRAGRWVAELYITTLVLVVFAFPFIFCAGPIFLAAWLLDVGSGRLGLFGAFLVFWFFALLFFSVFAWPHISPRIGKALDELSKRLNDDL